MEMLRIKEKDIIVDRSELLYRADFSNGGLEKDFEIAGGNWVAENGGVMGYMEEDGGGLIYSYRSFKGDVLLDFYGKIIAPYDNASKEHHIQTGRAGNNLFLFVDGELVVEMLDRKPLNKYGRVGLGVYASKIFFRDFKVYKPFVKKFETSYEELRKQD